MKIHEYNEMMSYLTRPGMRTGGTIGGGTIQGKDMGYRTGFVDPNLIRKQQSFQSYYDIFGKETLDKISKKEHGKVFSKLEGDTLSNLKRRVTKFKDFIIENNRMPSETEARSLGWSASRTLSEQGIQIKLVEDLKSGTVDINKLAKKYKIPVEELKTHAKRLERNVWKKRMETQPLKWLSDEGDILDNVMNSLYRSKLVQYKRDKIEHLFFDAFGRKTLEGTNTPNPSYKPKKWAAMRKNWNEYNKLRNSIKEIFPGIKFELDHPLSKSTLRTIFNASGDQLTRVNPMLAELNNGLKKSLDTQYKNAIANKNLTSKKAIEKIAGDLGLNIGRVSDDIKKYNFKINQFQNLNMGDELVKAVEQQANLAKNLPNYVKNNSELFKTAGIDIKTIKPVTPIKSSVINKIKTLIGNANIGIKPTDTQKTILKKINDAPIPKRAKVALLGVVGGVAAITGADLMTSNLQAAETETAAEEKDTGIPYEAGAAAATALGTYGSPIWKGVKTVGKTVIKPIMSPAVGAGFAASELMSEDPNVSLAGLEMLYPDIMKRLGSKVSTAKKFYDTVLRMGVAPRLVPHLIKGMTGAGLVMIAGDIAYGAHKLGQQLDWDPLTEEQRTDIQKRKQAAPKMLDTYEQASKIAKEQGISYEDALKQVQKPDVPGIDFNQGGRVGLKNGEDVTAAEIRKQERIALAKKMGEHIKIESPPEGSIFSKSGPQQVEGAPEGATSDKEFTNFIISLDIPITEKIDLLGKFGYGKFRDKREYEGSEGYLHDPKSWRERKVGIGYNEKGEGFGGHIKYDIGSGEPEAFIKWSTKFNQGGRVGFAKGPKDPTRRLVLKGITALAAVPIVGRFFKVGKLLEKAGRYTGPIIQKIKGMPDWFPLAVKRLWNEGEDVTKSAATMDRQIVKRGTLESGDDVDLIYDVGAGNVRIDVTPKKSWENTGSGAFNKEYGLELKKGETITEGKHAGSKTADEFKVTETEPVRTGHPEDPDWDWDGIDTTVDDAMSDLTELEAFAKKKTTKQIYKKKGTTKKDVNPEIEYDDDYTRDLDYDIE